MSETTAEEAPITGYLEAFYPSGRRGLMAVRNSSPAQLREAARVLSRNLQIRVDVLPPDRAPRLWAFVNGSDQDYTPAEPDRTLPMDTDTHAVFDSAQVLIAVLGKAGDALERVVELINLGRPAAAAVVASDALRNITAAVLPTVRE